MEEGGGREGEAKGSSSVNPWGDKGGRDGTWGEAGGQEGRGACWAWGWRGRGVEGDGDGGMVSVGGCRGLRVDGC